MALPQQSPLDSATEKSYHTAFSFGVRYGLEHNSFPRVTRRLCRFGLGHHRLSAALRHALEGAGRGGERRLYGALFICTLLWLVNNALSHSIGRRILEAIIAAVNLWTIIRMIIEKRSSDETPQETAASLV